ncbi:uncharacterized protein LOC101846152 [Aplysia californica]|uniref:Uncharacterized protein LOC101846152 n=1 Tax=Aplysia californica TaxID=6500 RepID=A0ABM0JXJ9_APLCA|nr:uncharacterized protein LOC101846152 [Aplysia californica]
MWSQTLPHCSLAWRCGRLLSKRIKLKQQTYCRGFHSSPTMFLFWRNGKNVGLGAFPTTMESRARLHDGRSLLDRYVFVKTLENYYDDVPSGIILDTAYADSQPNEDFDPITPVVVGLHDTPGSHKDLAPILNTFAKLGCRTIAPTFPGHGDTQGLLQGYDDVFSHSSTERAIFVHDFLIDLGIQRVDLLIGVGASCYTIMRMCAGFDSTEYYRSIALISPWPLTRPRFEKDLEASKKLQLLWDRPFFRLPMRMFLSGYRVGEASTPRDKVTTAYLLNNLDLGEAAGSALATSATNVPRTVIYGGMDPEVSEDLYNDLLDKLEIPQRNVAAFRGKLDAPLLPGALKFPDGGYDLHLQHPGIISVYLLNLIKLFHPHIRI